MKIKGKYLLAGGLILLSIALAYDSLTSYINPYLSVTQITGNPDRYVSKSIQVMGVVTAGSLVRGNDGTLSFTLTDGGETIGVNYRGAAPQNFDQGREVVVVGSLTEEVNLEASKILVKCPSKYESEDSPLPSNHLFLTAMVIALVAAAYLVVTAFWKRG